MQSNGENVPIYIGKCYGFILTAILVLGSFTIGTSLG